LTVRLGRFWDVTGNTFRFATPLRQRLCIEQKESHREGLNWVCTAYWSQDWHENRGSVAHTVLAKRASRRPSLSNSRARVKSTTPARKMRLRLLWVAIEVVLAERATMPLVDLQILVGAPMTTIQAVFFGVIVAW